MHTGLSGGLALVIPISLRFFPVKYSVRIETLSLQKRPPHGPMPQRVPDFMASGDRDPFLIS